MGVSSADPPPFAIAQPVKLELLKQSLNIDAMALWTYAETDKRFICNACHQLSTVTPPPPPKEKARIEKKED